MESSARSYPFDKELEHPLVAAQDLGSSWEIPGPELSGQDLSSELSQIYRHALSLFDVQLCCAGPGSFPGGRRGD